MRNMLLLITREMRKRPVSGSILPLLSGNTVQYLLDLTRNNIICHAHEYYE